MQISHLAKIWSHHKKQQQISNIRETKENMHQSKGFDKDYPKMEFQLNLSNRLKVMGI